MSEQPMTWLIVEDDPSIREILQTMCELWGIGAIVFKDGHEAQEYLGQAELPEPLPDFALLDIRLSPGPWGHEISAMIRAHPLLSNIGIALMTAFHREDREGTRQAFERSGADRLLTKPLPDMDELMETAREIIRERQAQK